MTAYRRVINTNNNTIFKLAGMGESKDNCGEWTGKAVYCSTNKAHYNHPIKITCKDKNCPICWEDGWLLREANKVEQRLKEGNRLYMREWKPLGWLKHISISPPRIFKYGKKEYDSHEMLKDSQQYKKLREIATKYILAAGFDGGAMVFHPFRYNSLSKQNFNPNVPVDTWYISPHFHLLGYGKLMKSNEFYEKYGWTYTNHGYRETAFGTICYVLDHCGVTNDRQSLIWIGLFANTKLVKDKVYSKEETRKCPVCKSTLHIGFIISPEEIEDNGIYKVKKRFYTFKLKS